MEQLARLLDVFAQTGVQDPNQFNGYLILGYLAMWIVVMIYLAFLAGRQRNAHEELRVLRQLLSEDEEQAGR
jgi:CcmD family protein